MVVLDVIDSLGALIVFTTRIQVHTVDAQRENVVECFAKVETYAEIRRSLEVALNEVVSETDAEFRTVIRCVIGTDCRVGSHLILGRQRGAAEQQHTQCEQVG